MEIWIIKYKIVNPLSSWVGIWASDSSEAFFYIISFKQNPLRGITGLSISKDLAICCQSVFVLRHTHLCGHQTCVSKLILSWQQNGTSLLL